MIDFQFWSETNPKQDAIEIIFQIPTTFTYFAENKRKREVLSIKRATI